MTTTTEEAPPVVSVGDRVRITELDPGWANGLSVGDVGTVDGIQSSASCCEGNHRYTITRDDGNEGFARAVEPVTERRPGEFRVGDRVRLLRFVGGDARPGDLGTVTEAGDGTSALYVRFDGRRTGARGDGEHYLATAIAYLELVEDEPEPQPEPETTVTVSVVTAGMEAELASLRERVERAERELEAFRTKVRDAVIEEAERRGWCNETDDWLVSIGLEPREPREQDYYVHVSVSFRAGTTVTVPATEADLAADLVDTSMVIDSIAGQLGIPARYLHDLDPDWEIDDVELAD